jgi:hypothetical protein
MSQTIVNLTLPIVVAKIDHLLNESPDWDQWSALANPDLRQRLAAYVLRRLPVVYTTLESTVVGPMNAPANCYSHAQHTQIEQLIHQGLQVLLEDESTPNIVSAQVLAESGLLPSTWFG